MHQTNAKLTSLQKFGHKNVKGRDMKSVDEGILDLRSSGILRGVVWQLFTDVSEQRIRLIFNGQESEDP
jgi:hypothetical protein